jgi:hypothetical protein
MNRKNLICGIPEKETGVPHSGLGRGMRRAMRLMF